MTGVRLRALVASVTVVAAATFAAPMFSRASDAAITILPGQTALAHAFDVDGDGARELVRLWMPGASGALELEIWSFDGDAWRATAAVPLTGFHGNAEVLADAPIALLEWRDAGRPRLLLAVGAELSRTGGTERLEFALVVATDRELRLQPMPIAHDGPADRIQAVDLDADGTDELLVTEPAEPQPESGRRLRVLRWDGERFVGEHVPVAEDAVVGEALVGETDGRPGADIILVSHEGAELFRVAADAGPSTSVERLDLSELDPSLLAVWPAAIARGTIYLYGERSGVPLFLGLRWPAGRSPTVAEVSADGLFRFRQPIWIGEQLHFLDDPSAMSPSGGWGGASLHAEDGALIAELPASAALDRSRRWLEAAGFQAGFFGPYPYTGDLPGGVGGRPAMIARGTLIVVGPDGDLQTRPAGSFAGTAPLGLVGPDEGWIAVTTTMPFTMAPGYLHPSFPTEDAVRIAPADAVLAPESDDGVLTVSFDGATPVTDPQATWVASADGGFTVTVEGPAGSQVAAVIGSFVEATGTIGEDGRIELRLDPRSRRDDTVEYTAGVVRLSPTGHVHATEWRGRVLRDAPALEATAETRVGAFEAVLRGTADRHATVTVDGTAVDVDPDGAFSLAVEAGLVPEAVVVRAVDPVGNETTTRLEVVGLVDYRGWPWVPIVGIATAALGAGMYLRAGRRQARPSVEILGEGTIEEIEAR